MYHTYHTCMSRNYAIVTWLTVSYQSETVVEDAFLRQFYHLVISSAPTLWKEENNHGLDASYNLTLLRALLLSQGYDTYYDWLSQFDELHMSNEYHGTCGNEDHPILRLDL